MKDTLSKLFHIRPAEWPRFLLIYISLLLIITGSAWGKTIVEAAFFAVVGVQFLPWVFMINAIGSIIAIAIYTIFADQVSNDKLMVAILIISTLGIVGGVIILQGGMEFIAYPLLYLLYYVVLVDVFNLHRATYLNGFYDTQAAKRVIPVAMSAIQVSSIVAGLSMPLVNYYLGDPSNIIILWAGMLFVAAIIVWLIPRILKETDEYPTVKRESPTLDQTRPSYLDNLREGYQYVARSTFLRWMAVSTLLLVILLTFLYYQASQILRDTYQTTQDIANFTGLLLGIANAIALPIQLFLLSRLIRRTGLGNAGLFFPGLTLFISGGIVFWPNIVTAALAYLDRNTFRLTFQLTTDSLFYNAVPLRVKGRARAFIGGFLTSIGSLIGGSLLLLPVISKTWWLAAIIGSLAIAYLGSMWMVRKRYTQALITMLEQEDFSFLLSSEALSLTVTDSATLNRLRQKLTESASPELTIFIAKLISQVGGQEAVPILEEVATTAADPRIRASMLDVLVAAEAEGEAARRLYTICLSDPDGQVRQSALTGLEQLAGSNNKEFLNLALTTLTDPDIEVRAKVLPALLQSNNPAYQLAAEQTLTEFFNDEQPSHRARGVRVLSQADGLQFVDKLVEHLTDPADEVRLEAALAIETLAKGKLSLPTIGLILKAVDPLFQDPVERVRQAALVAMGRIGTVDSYPALVNALTDPSPQVRTTAVEVLAGIGKTVIPIVHPLLDSPDSQQRKMAAVILSQINRRDFGPLVESYITANLLTIYHTLGRLAALKPCAGYPNMAVLYSMLKEQNQQLITEIFYLLSAVRDAEALERVAGSLQSENSTVRANAAEALEALTNPQTAKLLSPLFEPELDFAQLLELSQDAWNMSYPDTTTAVKQIISYPNDPFLRTMMTLALGEMGEALAPVKNAKGSPQPATILDKPTPPETGLGAEPTGRPEPAEPPQEPQPAARRPRRPNPADLLNSLVEESQTVPPQEEVKARQSRRPNPLDLLAPPASPPVEPPKASASAGQIPFTLPEIEALIDLAFTDPMIDVRLAARAAKQMIAGVYIDNLVKEEGLLLSIVEKIIFLKEVPFFQGMTIDQLKILANVCEEKLFEEDAHIFNQGDPGGALYVIVNGRVGIEQEKRKGSFARLATIEAHSYFGEMNLFDNSPRSATAVALQDTLTLRLRREPLIALARRHPELSLELINVLSQRLRESNDRVAELTRTKPRELHKLYDKFD